MKPKPFMVLNHFTVPLFMGDLPVLRVELDCARCAAGLFEIWGNVVSQARGARRGQVVRPKLDQRNMAPRWPIRKGPEHNSPVAEARKSWPFGFRPPYCMNHRHLARPPVAERPVVLPPPPGSSPCRRRTPSISPIKSIAGGASTR